MTDTMPPPSDNGEGPRDYSAADVMDGITKALKAGDMAAVAGLLKMLAVRDPASAQVLYDAVVKRELTLKIPFGRDN